MFFEVAESKLEKPFYTLSPGSMDVNNTTLTDDMLSSMVEAAVQNNIGLIRLNRVEFSTDPAVNPTILNQLLERCDIVIDNRIKFPKGTLAQVALDRVDRFKEIILNSNNIRLKDGILTIESLLTSESASFIPLMDGANPIKTLVVQNAYFDGKDSHVDRKKFLEHLSSLHHLESLTLEDMDLTDRDLLEVMNILANNPGIQTLRLGKNRYTLTGLDNLANFLRNHCLKLTTLDLGNRWINCGRKLNPSERDSLSSRDQFSDQAPPRIHVIHKVIERNNNLEKYKQLMKQFFEDFNPIEQKVDEMVRVAQESDQKQKEKSSEQADQKQFSLSSIIRLIVQQERIGYELLQAQYPNHPGSRQALNGYYNAITGIILKKWLDHYFKILMKNILMDANTLMEDYIGADKDAKPYTGDDYNSLKLAVNNSTSLLSLLTNLQKLSAQLNKEFRSWGSSQRASRAAMQNLLERYCKEIKGDIETLNKIEYDVHILASLNVGEAMLTISHTRIFLERIDPLQLMDPNAVILVEPSAPSPEEEKLTPHDFVKHRLTAVAPMSDDSNPRPQAMWPNHEMIIKVVSIIDYWEAWLDETLKKPNPLEGGRELNFFITDLQECDSIMEKLQREYPEQEETIVVVAWLSQKQAVLLKRVHEILFRRLNNLLEHEVFNNQKKELLDNVRRQFLPLQPGDNFQGNIKEILEKFKVVLNKQTINRKGWDQRKLLEECLSLISKYETLYLALDEKRKFLAVDIESAEKAALTRLQVLGEVTERMPTKMQKETPAKFDMQSELVEIRRVPGLKALLASFYERFNARFPGGMAPPPENPLWQLKRFLPPKPSDNEEKIAKYGSRTVQQIQLTSDKTNDNATDPEGVVQEWRQWKQKQNKFSSTTSSLSSLFSSSTSSEATTLLQTPPTDVSEFKSPPFQLYYGEPLPEEADVSDKKDESEMTALLQVSSTEVLKSKSQSPLHDDVLSNEEADALKSSTSSAHLYSKLGTLKQLSTLLKKEKEGEEIALEADVSSNEPSPPLKEKRIAPEAKVSSDEEEEEENELKNNTKKKVACTL